MKLALPLALVISATLLAAAIYLRPVQPPAYMQALYGDGYIYVIDLNRKNIANIIPGKTAPE